MFWNYLIAFVMVWVSIFWASFGITIPMIILRFANPLIGYLDVRHLINGKAARKRNALTLLIWFIIDVVYIGVILLVGNVYVIVGAGIGLLLNLIFGAGKTGKTNDNMSEFIQSYGNYFTTDDESALKDALVIFMQF